MSAFSFDVACGCSGMMCFASWLEAPSSRAMVRVRVVSGPVRCWCMVLSQRVWRKRCKQVVVACGRKQRGWRVGWFRSNLFPSCKSKVTCTGPLRKGANNLMIHHSLASLLLSYSPFQQTHTQTNKTHKTDTVPSHQRMNAQQLTELAVLSSLWNEL